MAITINTPVIHKSYASVLSRIDPNALIFDNPNQQGTKLPAWFIVHREPVSSTCAIDGYQWVVYAIDIYYMVEYNKPRLFDEYAAIADQLDLELEYLPIYGTDTVVHVFDRSWEMAMNALKYSTTLRLRVHPSVQREPYMQVIENLEVFLKMQNEAILSFQNTSHPEFDAQLPNPISVTKGRTVNLPFVGGEFEDDNYKWTPSGWTLGNFGALIQLNESMTADLLWRSEEKTASLSFTNTLHPEFEVELPDTIIANKGSSVELPAVSGTFPVGSFDWNPSSWDIGSFGGSFTLNEDTTADLQWESEEVFFDLSFTNTSHPEFDVTLPQSEHVSRGSSVTLPTVEGEFIQDNYKWNPDAWDIGAFGDSYTPSDSVSANLLWRSEERSLPTVSKTGVQEGNYWLTFNRNGTAIDFGNGQTSPIYYNSGNYNYIQQTYDPTKLYAVIALHGSGVTIGNGINVENSSGNLFVRNSTGNSYSSLYGGYIAQCDDLSATVITVYKDLDGTAYNSFKYTMNGTDYYYVLDQTQTNWTDDLTSIGYSLEPPAPLELTAYFNNTGSAYEYDTRINQGGGANLYAASGAALYYDSSKTYTITGLYNAAGELLTFGNGDSFGNNSTYLHYNRGINLARVYAHHITYTEAERSQPATLEAYFTNQGAAGTSDTEIGSISTLYDATGAKLLYRSGTTYTIVSVKNINGNDVVHNPGDIISGSGGYLIYYPNNVISVFSVTYTES